VSSSGSRISFCGKQVLNGDSMPLKIPVSGFKRAKFKMLVQYVCWKTGDTPARMGATKLNKILWYAETGNYLRTGAALTGAKYVKRQHGPVPACIPHVLRELEEEKKVVSRRVPYYDREQIQFIGMEEPKIDKFFAASEISNIDHLIDAVCDGHTASSISTTSHNEAWELAELGEELPLFTVLAQSKDLTEEDLKWADAKINEIEARVA
jgi:Protein of unknown function (DUF4065)